MDPAFTSPTFNPSSLTEVVDHRRIRKDLRVGAAIHPVPSKLNARFAGVWSANRKFQSVTLRIAGYSTGTKNFRTERLDEYVGDCVNSTAFPATCAFCRY